MQTLQSKNPTRARPWLRFAGLALVTALAALVWDALTPRSEARFALHMIPHHAQAVEMARMLQSRTDDATLQATAADIIATQQSQIEQMRTWLPVWRRPLMGLLRHGLSPRQVAEMGMASEAEMRAFAALTGREAEARFLQLMIRHHQGAIAMMGPALEAAQNPAARRLLAAMAGSQALEIESMRQLLDQRGGEPLEPPPAAGHPH
jgi:uncharacterized protein (DUF305 family)